MIVKKHAMRLGLIFLILSLALFPITSCYDRSVHLMEVDLSEGLIRIDYAHIENGDTEEEFYKIKVYKTLNLEEQEYVLSEINGIEFCKNTFPRKPELYGEGLVFYYTSYRLFVTSHTVHKEPFNLEANGERLWYDIGHSDQIVELLNMIKN